MTTVDVPQVGADEGARLVQDGAFLLDVREPEEWLAGHAPTATHIPLGEVTARVAELPRDATVVAICRMGGRSQQAAEFLERQLPYIDSVDLDTAYLRIVEAAEQLHHRALP